MHCITIRVREQTITKGNPVSLRIEAFDCIYRHKVYGCRTIPPRLSKISTSHKEFQCFGLVTSKTKMYKIISTPQFGRAWLVYRGSQLLLYQ
jgi:hypothetical protein